LNPGWLAGQRLAESLEKTYGTGNRLMGNEIVIRDAGSPARPVSFRLLGGFQVIVAGREVGVGPPQVQRFLVKLLAAKGAPVATEELMAAVWDDVYRPGASNERVHGLAAVARRGLTDAGLPDVLVNEYRKYRLDVPPALVDVHQFHELTARARELARDGDRRAVGMLEQALALRSGEPLAGLGGGWVDRYRLTLAAELRTTETLLYEAAIRHGEAYDRLPGLSALQRERPADERVTWLYMHALYRVGQPATALAVKQEFDRHLSDAYGLDAGHALNDLQQRILRKDDDLLTPEAVSFPDGEARSRSRRPGAGDSPGAAEPGTDARLEADTEPEADAERDEPSSDQQPDRPAATSMVVNLLSGPVDAKHAVFGTQVNLGVTR
jgi:DNA-binding SARP family transcriptional activator